MVNKNVRLSTDTILNDLKKQHGNIALIGDHSGWHVKIMRWDKSTSHAEKSTNEWVPITLTYDKPELAIIAALKESNDISQENQT